MGARKPTREGFWALIHEIAASKPLESERAWRAALKKVITRDNADAFDAELSKVFASAVNREFFEAFNLYTDHVDADFFASFIAALILNGPDAFARCTADPQQLVALGLPNDMYFEAEGLVPAAQGLLRSLGVKSTLDLQACSDLTEATLARIHGIDLTGAPAFRPRQADFESKEAHQFRHRSAVFRSRLAERWPELARAGQQ